MKTSSGLKAYGAEIISYSKEMKNTLSIKLIKESFNVENVYKNFKIDRVQKKYFVINSFEQLDDSLNEVEIKI
ncbi:MAG: hypothetical protein CMC04_10570 [Flavobacteriaceae bacterium]|nr:hypothetical protein [Flavobacteriaceae bacterium]|tara:strand:- start:1012 stop:1230 length:219 start_codon:yes stop_codon:yes gene_type:complete